MPSSPLRRTDALRLTCVVLVFGSLLVAAFNLTRRVHAEYATRAVEIIVDYQQVEWLAAMQGVSVDTALARMKEAGATTIALPEETLFSLEQQGLLTIAGKIGWADAAQRLPEIWSPDDPVFTVITSNPNIRSMVIIGLLRVYQRVNLLATDTIITVRGERAQVGQLGLGLSPEKIARIHQAELRIAPRLTGEVNLNARAIDESLEAISHALPARVQQNRPHALVIFDGKSVLGFSKLIPNVAQALHRYHFTYGMLESGEQRGDIALGGALHGQLVRVHSIRLEELEKMSSQRARARFALAVKDRNIRAAFVRFPPQASNAPLDDAAQYLYQITQEIRHMPGMRFTIAASSPAHPFPALNTDGLLLAALSAGAGAATLLWLLMILPRRLPMRWVAAGVLLLLFMLCCAFGLAWKMPSQGRTYFALLASVAFPLISLTWAYTRLHKVLAHPPRHFVLMAVGALLASTLITLVGGLLIAAMLTSTVYMVKLAQFSGVKLALGLPLLLFSLLAVSDAVASEGETVDEYWTRVSGNIRALLQRPLYLWGALLGLLVIGVIGYMLLRSGNAGRETALNAELLVRAQLESLLAARPRTKEFLIGFPLFLLSMTAAALRRRTLAIALLIGAGIGQVDVLNTYCHAHSPLLLSLMRTGNGLFLGMLLGLIALTIAWLLLRPRRLHAE